MDKENGVLLAATFSYGCQQARIVGVSSLLEEYAKNGGEKYSQEEIKRALNKLVSFFFYRVIALANNIEDPFDIRIVKAHWIGSELLEKVKISHIGKVFKEFEENGWDPTLLAFSVKPVVEEKKFIHHNIYARQNPECSVTVKNGYLWHLGQARIKALPEDIENIKKYGEG